MDKAEGLQSISCWFKERKRKRENYERMRNLALLLPVLFHLTEPVSKQQQLDGEILMPLHELLVANVEFDVDIDINISIEAQADV